MPKDGIGELRLGSKRAGHVPVNERESSIRFVVVPTGLEVTCNCAFYVAAVVPSRHKTGRLVVLQKSHRYRRHYDTADDNVLGCHQRSPRYVCVTFRR